MSAIDVVVVSYNSRDRLRACVEPLAGVDELSVVVVDNASPDGSLEAISDLAAAVERIQLARNGGFAHGCNVGWRAGSSPFVLFLNPDATIKPRSMQALADVLLRDPAVAAAGPRVLESDGTLDFSQRRFSRLRATWSQALALNRLFPGASWGDDIVRAEEAYATSGSAEWLSGACLLVRRSALEELGGWDETFFLYCEDMDLCRRLRLAGWEVRFVAEATCTHTGGGSGSRAALRPILTQSRIRYARKHRRGIGWALQIAGIAVGELTRAAGASGSDRRRSHLRSLGAWWNEVVGAGRSA